MNKKMEWTFTTSDGVVHWAADRLDCDTNIACDMRSVDLQINCPQCLMMHIEVLTRDLNAARHALHMSNPEGYSIEDCVYCVNNNEL